MISKLLVLAQRIWRTLWVRVVLISLFSLIALAVAPLLTPFIPDNIKLKLGREAILPVLTILASGMLAVTTFSLNVMVSAYRAASSMATPRAYRLLLDDTITQSVLATFVGGFVYSLSAVILFHARVYSEDASVVVFAVTMVVFALIVLAILRWIEHLSHLGSMDHTLQIIEHRAREAMHARARRPSLGARRRLEDDMVPDAAGSIMARKTGYIRFIDVSRLNELAEEAGTDVFISSVPGEFVLRNTVIGTVASSDESLLEPAARAFDIGDVRTFEQDPTLGLSILAESGQRALSPGINDPGTAVEVLGRIERLLWEETPVAPQTEAEYTPTFPRVTLPVVRARTLLDCAVLPIARDGADNPDVTARIFDLLTRISAHPNEAMARAAADMQDQLSTR
ncbi:DUF2254 domain-containing protein [Marinovum sp.]|uniref:DUF2254 domain-containing protein n=1 Tax=Marinovum sp. TaxID=2024839 RepID=UPI002B269909|nr:DUF2254 domain-containing protein [Marinovum sp.]